jgi:hypothetical protein
VNVEARFKIHAVAGYLFLTIRLDYTPTIALEIVEKICSQAVDVRGALAQEIRRKDSRPEWYGTV